MGKWAAVFDQYVKASKQDPNSKITALKDSLAEADEQFDKYQQEKSRQWI